LIRREFINCWSCGIVVASTSMPETLVCGGAPAAPDTPSKSATRVVRRRKSRSRLFIA
jgi:hypothetical protein